MPYPNSKLPEDFPSPEGKCLWPCGFCPHLHFWSLLLLPPHVMLQVWASCGSLDEPSAQASELGRSTSSPCPLGLLLQLLADSSWSRLPFPPLQHLSHTPCLTQLCKLKGPAPSLAQSRGSEDVWGTTGLAIGSVCAHT